MRPVSLLCSLTLIASTLSAGAVPAQAAKPKFKPAADGARITGYKWLTKNKRRFDFRVKSPALGGKSMNVRVLLPRGWSMKAKRTWPVVYAYHGGQDTYVSWTRSTGIEQLAARWDAIVVMPDGANGSYTDWYNYGKGGTPKWETFHVKEIVQLMERNFRAGRQRAAFGISSGGQGAITYAARHPGLFKYAASLSGILHMRDEGVPTMLRTVNSGNGQDPDAIWGVYPLHAKNWKAHNPWDLAVRLRGTKIFFSSGTSGKPGPGDDPNTAPWDIGLLSERITGQTNVSFRKRLKQLKIPHTAHIYADGRHNWPAWRREYVYMWPRLMKAIGARKY